MYLSFFIVVVEVNFQLTSISVTEDTAQAIIFTLDINGQDANSTTTVYLTVSDGSASKCTAIIN